MSLIDGALIAAARTRLPISPVPAISRIGREVSELAPNLVNPFTSKPPVNFAFKDALLGNRCLAQAA